MLKEFETFRRQSAAKEDEVRQLQVSSMGDMHINENERLKSENESKSESTHTDLFDQYYNDVFAQASDTRNLLDLDSAPPSEKALEGTLITLATHSAKPLEFSGNTKVIDLINDRPSTRLSNDVANLSVLGLNTINPGHAFFAECYMKFPADPSFCKDGIMDNTSTVVSLPPDGAFPARASIIKKIPRNFRNVFSYQQGSLRVSKTADRGLTDTLV